MRASKSNGMMENAVKIWQEQLRTIKHDVESKFKRRIEVEGVLVGPGGAFFDTRPLGGRREANF